MEVSLKETKIINKKSPKCNRCWFPNQDDPQRMLVSFNNPETERIQYGIRCPNIISPFGKGCTKIFETESRKEIKVK